MRHAPEPGTRPHSSTRQLLLLGSVLAVSLIAAACPADAARTSQKPHDQHAATPATATLRHASLRPAAGMAPAQLRHATYTRPIADRPLAGRHGAGLKTTKSGKARMYAGRYSGGGGLQCVPFARAASGIELKGNAVNWWDAAAGVYERGSHPEPGSVLNFRANGSMRLGHVAVVRQVVNSREIEIDHANWAWSGKGNVSRGVTVIDVSERNDWSAVRVALGHNGDFGSVYSTYGFIYDRPDSGTMVAAGPRPSLGAPSRDLRGGYDEVAEDRGHFLATAYEAPVRSVR